MTLEVGSKLYDVLLDIDGKFSLPCLDSRLNIKETGKTQIKAIRIDKQNLLQELKTGHMIKV
jgi:hypothetical protein